MGEYADEALDREFDELMRDIDDEDAGWDPLLDEHDDDDYSDEDQAFADGY